MILAFTLMFSLIGTGFMSYSLWTSRDDKIFSIQQFKKHIEQMELDIANLTSWNDDMETSIEFYESENAILKEINKEYKASDDEIKEKYKIVTEADKRLSADTRNWDLYIKDNVFAPLPNSKELTKRILTYPFGYKSGDT